MPTQYTTEEVGARIRSRNPSAFSKFTDQQIGERAVQRKPELGKLVKTAAAPVAPGPDVPVEDNRTFTQKASDAISDPELGMKVAGQAVEAGKGFLKGAGSTLFGIGKLGANTLGKIVAPGLQKIAPVQEKPQFLQPNNTAQKVGFGAEQLGEFFLPGGVLGKGAKGIEAATEASKLPQVAKYGLDLLGKSGLEATGMAGVTAAQGGTGKEVAQNALLGAGGAVAGEGLNALGKKVAPWLKGSAEKDFAQVLNPTTKENKAKAASIIPGLIENKTTAFTQQGLAKKIGTKLDTAGANMDAVLAGIPDNAPVNINNVIAKLEDAKFSFMVKGANGKMVIADPAAVKHIQGFQDILKEVGGTDAPFASVRKLRQIWDKGIAQAKGFYGKTLTEGSLIDAQKEAASALREELVKGRPDLERVNKDYHFWAKAQKVIGDTVERTQSQAKPLGQRILGAAGTAGGFATGGLGGAVAGNAVMNSLGKLVNSTGWKTISALQKTNLASLIGSGKNSQALSLITKLLGSANTNK